MSLKLLGTSFFYDAEVVIMGFLGWFEARGFPGIQKSRKREKRQAHNLNRVKEGVIAGALGARQFVLIRKDVVDLVLKGKELPGSRESQIAALVGGLIGRTQEASILAAQRYAEGRVIVEYYRSGSDAIEGTDIWDAPSYLVLL